MNRNDVGTLAFAQKVFSVKSMQRWGSGLTTVQTTVEPPGPQRRRGRTDEEHGRSVAFYHSFGEYDGVIIFESPDDTSAAAGLLAAISPRHVKAIKKTTLLSVEDAIEAMRRAGEVPYENRDSRPICVKGAGA